MVPVCQGRFMNRPGCDFVGAQRAAPGFALRYRFKTHPSPDLRAHNPKVKKTHKIQLLVWVLKTYRTQYPTGLSRKTLKTP